MAGRTRYRKNGDPINEVAYEWVVEYVDAYGDIIDLDHGDTLEGVFASWRDFRPDAECVRVDLALQRRYGNDDDGEIDRGYAYVREGELEAEFDSGHKVPARFRKQIERRIGGQ